MFNSGILDVAIGIVFIYLLVSLIVTAVNELIAAIFKMRGRVLWQGLCTLLPSGTNKENMAEEVYRHPLIAGLSHDGRPSYIPSHTFALALLDVISGGTGHIAKPNQLQGKIDLLPANLRRSLNLLLHESKGDLEKFRMNIEAWFNDSMDRVSGVYKRKVQYALFFLAFLLAIFLNIDTIVLANRLSHDSALRAALVASATSAANQPAPQGGSGDSEDCSAAGSGPGRDDPGTGSAEFADRLARARRRSNASSLVGCWSVGLQRAAFCRMGADCFCGHPRGAVLVRSAESLCEHSQRRQTARR